MIFVIEHLEPKLSEWLQIEYSHAARIVGRRLLITNVKNKSEFGKLAETAHIERERTCELFKPLELIVLDPRARKELSPPDFWDKKAVVIGGILGEEPPLGRTRKLLTKTLPGAIARNLGEYQFAIDGATYMAKRVLEGERLEDLPVRVGFEIKISGMHSVHLPYAYPLVEDKPLISPELVGYLKRSSW